MKKIINWFKNYLYYYKFRILVGAIVIAIAAFGIYGFVSRGKYDYTIYLCVSANASSEFQNSVKAAVAQYGEDLDGNGSVDVQLINMSYDFTNPSSDEAAAKVTLLAGELQTGGNFIFFYDEDYYQKCLSPLFEKHDYLQDKNNTAQNIKGTDIEKYMKAGLSSVGFDADSIPQLYMSLRHSPDKSKNTYQRYEKDLTLFENIAKNKINSTAATTAAKQ